jgi:hypothetical protein
MSPSTASSALSHFGRRLGSLRHKGANRLSDNGSTIYISDDLANGWTTTTLAPSAGAIRSDDAEQN